MAQEARSKRVTAAVATELRALMGRQQVKPSQLAEMTGIARSTMSNLLNGKAAMDVDQLAKICAALGVQPGDVMGAALADDAHPFVPRIDTRRDHGLDPRSLIEYLLTHPEQDERLITLLTDALGHSGISGPDRKHLEAEIRETRQRELQAALAVLPSGDTSNSA